MGKEILYAKRFRKSLKNINKNRYYIQKNFYDVVLSKVENLKWFPNMYPKFEKSKYRKIPIKNFIILYTIEENQIKVYDIIPIKSNYNNQLY